MNNITIPQIESTLLSLLAVAAIALYGPIEAGVQDGTITSFAMLLAAVKAGAFGATMSALKVVFGWIMLKSPLKPKDQQ
jgi:hypothetical protein